MARPSAPKRGDFVWLEFDPKEGREQGGRRPALIISSTAYNERVGLALCCPITSQIKGYPFEVPLPDGLKVAGTVLADHVKCVDWRARQCKRIGPAPRETLDEVVAKVAVLIESP